MFDLFLPFVLGLAIGIEPAQQDTPQTAEAAEATLPEIDSGSGDDLTAAREPEDQTPTGQFTTAVEVRPILGMTKSNWVAVRNYEGRDLVYFSHLLSWRCGLWDIRYGVNGEPADNVFAMEPCNVDMAQPNVLADPINFPIYVEYPPESVETIYVEITFDDGTTDFAQFNRNEILIP